MKALTPIAALLIGIAGTAGAQDITVSSKIDTEGGLLGNMILLALQDAGLPVQDRLQLGGTPIMRDAIMAASRLDPHSRFTVVAGTEVGRPASSTAIRPTFRFSSPAPLAFPQTTSSIPPGSRPGVLASNPVSTVAARSSGRICESPPPSLPNGLRIAA